MKFIYCPDNSFIDSCGFVHTIFHKGSDKNNSEALERSLEKFAVELKYEDTSLLFLEDFNNCNYDCRKLLKQILTEHWLETPGGKVVSAKKAIILLTSDLTQFGGIELRKEEAYIETLTRVEDVARNVWNKDSLIIKNNKLIPFAHFTTMELDKVLTTIFEKFEIELKHFLRQQFYLLEREKQDKNIEHIWTGRFICSEETKANIVIGLYNSIKKENSKDVLKRYITRIEQLASPNLFDKMRNLSPKFSKPIKYIYKTVLGVSFQFNAYKTKRFTYVEDIVLEVDKRNVFSVSLHFVSSINSQTDD